MQRAQAALQICTSWEKELAAVADAADVADVEDVVATIYQMGIDASDAFPPAIAARNAPKS
jgi:hypothetical protein